MKTESLDVVVNRGVLRLSRMTAEYHTRQPAPGQWIAVGLVAAGGSGLGHLPRSLVVGTGTSEERAVEDLCQRLSPVRSTLSDEFVAEWSYLAG